MSEDHLAGVGARALHLILLLPVRVRDAAQLGGKGERVAVHALHQAAAHAEGHRLWRDGAQQRGERCCWTGDTSCRAECRARSSGQSVQRMGPDELSATAGERRRCSCVDV